MISNISEYINNNKQKFIDELFDLIRIPSVSAKPEHKKDMREAAENIREQLLHCGADVAQVISTGGHPVVFGEKIINNQLPVILIYGHYDVQPAEPFELWESDPFEPVIRDGKIYARGADDDKGQLFMQFKAFEVLTKTNNLPCNVKFLIEGEEEIGSANLKPFCEKHRDMLKADVIMVSDTTMLGPDIPSITIGLRGITYYDVEITGPNRDLHSGLYGGSVANPINMLAEMISSLTNEKHQIIVPGFYDDIMPVTDEERKELARAPFDPDLFKKSIGVNALVGEQGYTTPERTGIRPSIDVCGIWGGFTGNGAKTVIPSKAFAKISMRLVPNQDHHKIDQLFTDYFHSIAPPGIQLKITPLHGGRGYIAPITSLEYKAASKALEKTFGKRPVPTRSGGSIPVIADFEEVLGLKSILMGFGLESDAIHSPNENFPLANFFKGIETIPLFYKYYSELKNK